MNKSHPFSAAYRFGAAFLFALSVALVPASAATKAPTPKITISVQPTAKVEITATNQSPTISVTATLSPSGTLAYQWFKGKTAITDATQSSLTVTLPGSYTCKISGGTAKAVTSKASVATTSFAPATLPLGMVINAFGTSVEKNFNTDDGARTVTDTEQNILEITDVTAKKMLAYDDTDIASGDLSNSTSSYTYKRVSSNKGIVSVSSDDSDDKATVTLIFTGFNTGTYVLAYKGSYTEGSYRETWSGKGVGTFTVDYAE